MREIIEPLLTDPVYRRWFKAWWELDFSIAGLNERQIDWNFTDAPLERLEYEGRLWARGWMPPHNLEGALNPAFFEGPQPDWQARAYRRVREGHSVLKLDGAWLTRVELAEVTTPLSLSLEATFLAEGLTVSTARQLTLSMRGCFALAPIALQDIALQSEANLAGVVFRQSLSLNSIGGARIKLDFARIDGGLQLAGLNEVSARKAIIGNDLLVDTRVMKLDARQARVDGNVVVRGVSGYAPAQFDFRKAHLRAPFILGSESTLQSLDLSSAILDDDFTAEGGSVESLAAHFLTVRGSLRLRGSFSANQIYFDKAHIVGEADFEGCSFRHFNCAEAVFVSDTKFANCTFATLNAHEARFRKLAEFWRCTFSSEIGFTSAQIGGVASFRGSAFSGPAYFTGTKFEAGADFSAEPNAVPNGGRFHVVNFRNCEFLTRPESTLCADFDKREFGQSSTFDGATFRGEPRFFDAKFHENASFRGTRFIEAPLPEGERFFGMDRKSGSIRERLKLARDASNAAHQRHESAYRALRKRMTEIGSAKDERTFLALELRSRRKRSDHEVTLVESILSVTYDWVSDYGESIVRPLTALVLLTALAAAIYYFQTPSSVDWAKAAEFALQQLFKPFNAWSDTGALLVKEAPRSGGQSGSPLSEVRIGLGLKSVASVQSLLSLTLLFLVVLAIRRRFRLG